MSIDRVPWSRTAWLELSVSLHATLPRTERRTTGGRPCEDRGGYGTRKSLLSEFQSPCRPGGLFRRCCTIQDDEESKVGLARRDVNEDSMSPIPWHWFGATRRAPRIAVRVDAAPRTVSYFLEPLCLTCLLACLPACLFFLQGSNREVVRTL